MTTRDEAAFETLRTAFEDDLAVSDDDAAMLDRVVQRAMGAAVVVAAASAAAPSVAKAATSTAARSSVTKLALSFAAGVAVTVGGGVLYLTQRSVPVQPPPVSFVVPAAAPVVAPAVTPPSVETKGVAIEDLPVAPASQGARVGAPTLATAAPAADLFREANNARREGRTNDAIGAYKNLIATWPAAAETRAARVSLGVLLDKAGAPQAALEQFDAYLAGSPRDSLAEEARLGRAVVLQRLGRTSEERRAWQSLIDQHPDSLHVARAKERLQALSGSPR